MSSPTTKVTSTTRPTSSADRPYRPTRSSIAAKALVRAGWNRVSITYRPDTARATYFGLTADHTRRWLRPFFDRLPHRARVLDLGCGCGLPVARQLARRFDVVGVDLSDVQIARARRLVPSARFRRADMSQIRFPAGSAHGVVALYSLIHLPLAEQRPLLARIHRWLAPAGLLPLIAGETAYTGTEANWLGSGAQMFWSHADAATYQRWLEGTGFVVERRTLVRERGGRHVLFVARRGTEKSELAGHRAAPRHSASVRT